ncbi:hypothetical protein [Brumimicrobium mesophilum]|uniref:hypothetical protein n=1 Tax=Brumimicrobium mesophilum TaxID=392717 RepID=UPI000D141785|nr:hypothetical protein [Brumimicrobium mesophilum]
MQNSQTVTFLEDKFDRHPNCYNGWSESYVQLIVKSAIKALDDEENSDEITFSNYSQKRMVGTNSYSEICYIETQEVGFFFVMRNMNDQINVVYSRWD